MYAPYISGWLYMPVEAAHDLAELKNLLTVSPKPFKDEPPKYIPVYDESVPGYIGMPPDWGFTYIPDNVTVEDRTSMGSPIGEPPKRPDPFHPQAAPGQAKFIDDIRTALQEDYTVLAKAATGSGKTVATLATHAELGVTTVVMTHLKRLQKQWIDEAKDKLGYTDDDIGIVQGPKCNYEGKKLVIAMMPTLIRRDYPQEFYDYFGFSVIDEVHRCGAPMLARVLGKFTSAYNLALTATTERPDFADRVYKLFYGEPKVISNQKALPVTYYSLPYRTHRPTWGDDHSVRIKCLTKDNERNDFLVRYIRKMFFDRRCVLGIGESLEHIEIIRSKLVASGIDENLIGLFTNQYLDPEGKRHKTTDEYLDWCLETPPIILATYGMMKEGISVARLSGGIDLTPQTKIVQVIGRVRRYLPGKTDSVWYSPCDLAFGSFIGYEKKRLKELKPDPTVKVVRL